MTFTVIYTERAKRDLTRLPLDIAQRCINAIAALKADPFPHVKKLKGFKQPSLYSLRVSDYRIILSIQEENICIYVLDVSHRRNVYRKY